MNRPSSLSHSYSKCSIPLIIFVFFCWTCSTESLSFLYCGVQSWIQHSRCIFPVLNRMNDHPPQQLDNSALQQSRVLLGLLCYRTTLLVHVQAGVLQDSQVLFCNVTSQLFGPQLRGNLLAFVSVWGYYSQVEDLAFPFIKL